VVQRWMILPSDEPTQVPDYNEMHSYCLQDRGSSKMRASIQTGTTTVPGTPITLHRAILLLFSTLKLSHAPPDATRSGYRPSLSKIPENSSIGLISSSVTSDRVDHVGLGVSLACR
jgi:hypothetical protein